MNHILENMTNREDFSLSEIYSVNYPQQQGNDCGLCVLKTIEVLINNFWEINKAPDKLLYMNSVMKWYNIYDPTQLRKTIIDTIPKISTVRRFDN